jgi:hypothetical protein
VRQKLTETDAVFEGRVLRIETRLDSTVLEDGYLWRMQMNVATVQTTGSWRGVTVSTVQVVTPAQTTACGAMLRAGESYIFFAARADRGELVVSKCDPPVRAQDAVQVRALLDSSQTVPLRPPGTAIGSVESSPQVW